MAMGMQQNLGFGCIVADAAQEGGAESVRPHCGRGVWPAAAWPRRSARAIDDDERLKAVFVMVRVEQPQLLAALHGSNVSSISSTFRVETLWTRNIDRFTEVGDGVEHAAIQTQLGEL